MGPLALPTTREEIRDRVNHHLHHFVTWQARALHAIAPELSDVTAPLLQLIQSGKRLRPEFCYWGWRAVPGGENIDDPLTADAVIAASVSLELLQAAALVHDDVIDASDLRRGNPTIHRLLEAHHRDNGWHTSSARFGESAAILLGDLCLTWTDEAYFASQLSRTTLLRAKPALDAMRTEVTAGQYLDLAEQVRADTDVARITRVMRLKSAKYTVERPLHVGGLLAGATPLILKAYSAYGLALGEAFQLRDDVLGVFGDPELTGKPAGDDLREGKRTLLVALAEQAATAEQKNTLRQLLGDAALSVEQVNDIRALMRTTGALEQVEQRITTLRESALTALDTVELEPTGKRMLTELASAATTRQH